MKFNMHTPHYVYYNNLQLAFRCEHILCYFCIKHYSDALQTTMSTCYFEIFIISDLISTHKFMKIHIRTHNYLYYKNFQLIYRYEHSTTLILYKLIRML
jgi:hypothetical protein